MSREKALLVLLALVWIAAAPRVYAEEASTPLADRLSAVAERLLARLPAEADEEALFPFASDEREDVHYAPFPLDGARQGELPAEASRLVDELLATTLSRAGYAKVQSIRNLEPAVARKDRERFFGLGRVTGSLRDSGRYFLALFGKPGGSAPWAFRYDGHHVSLNVTVKESGPPATTPLFLGAEPRRVPEGWPAAGTQALGEEEEQARALYAALGGELRARATLPYEKNRGLMLGQVRRVASAPAVGVARAELPADAQEQLDALVETLLADFAPEIAAARRAEIDAAGRDALRFAFVDAAEPRGAFYWRITGPRTLIELDNTTDGDHLHLVWHDLAGDFGDDLLATHYEEAHGVVLGR